MSGDVLESPGFVVLATMVAFNTLLYVGLTIAKLIPWPRQFRPSRVRRWLGRFGVRPDEESSMSEVPQERAAESDDPFKALRYAAARETIPEALALGGGLVMVVAATSGFILHTLTFTAHVMEFLIGLGGLVMGVVLRYRGFTGLTMIRCFATAATFLVFFLLVEGVALNSLAPVAFSTVVMTAYMPIVVDWLSALLAAAAMLVGIGIAGLQFSLLTGLALEVLAFAGLMAGAVLMQVRLREIRKLAAEQALSASLATTDLLTGLMTKRGLLTLAPMLAANANRSGLPVFVVSVRVEQLAKARRDYGVHYVDEVMRTASDVVRRETRVGDGVARWDQDELVILGQGAAPDAGGLNERFNAAVQDSGVALGRWPIVLTVGSADGDTAGMTFEMLLETARTRRPRLESV